MPLSTLQSVPHDPDCKTQGQDGLRIPFLQDSFIPCNMPVYPDALSVPKIFRSPEERTLTNRTERRRVSSVAQSHRSRECSSQNRSSCLVYAYIRSRLIMDCPCCGFRFSSTPASRVQGRAGITRPAHGNRHYKLLHSKQVGKASITGMRVLNYFDRSQAVWNYGQHPN